MCHARGSFEIPQHSVCNRMAVFGNFDPMTKPYYRLSLFLSFTALVLFCSILSAQEPAPSNNSVEKLPPVPGQVITLTPEAGFHNEPSIAVNPSNAAQVAAAYQVPATVAFSRDGGNSWKVAVGTAPTDYRVSGDVSITYDKHGAAVLCYIAFDKLGTDNYWARGATRNGIFVRRSVDGGATWDPQAHAVIAQPTRPGIPFEDKPYIAADNTNSKFAGNLYVGWTEFRIDESVILFSGSTDGGLSWSSPIEISAHHGLPRDDNAASRASLAQWLPTAPCTRLGPMVIPS